MRNAGLPEPTCPWRASLLRTGCAETLERRAVVDRVAWTQTRETVHTYSNEHKLGQEHEHEHSGPHLCGAHISLREEETSTRIRSYHVIIRPVYCLREQ